MQVALQTNAELLQLPDKYEASDSAAILAQVSADLNSPAESTRLEALHWVSSTSAIFFSHFICFSIFVFATFRNLTASVVLSCHVASAAAASGPRTSI